MKAKIIKTGEIVDVYHEPQHGQVSNIYKESVFVNGRLWQENELEFIESKEVNLEKEIEEVKHNYKVDDNRHTSICSADIEWLAQHFYELGSAVSNKAQNIWHDASEKLPTGVIVVNNGGNLHIGWSTDEGDGIEDEHGHLITKTYQKWAREKDLT